ncbi:glycogen/starch/alpha-glucan phosphorylase [Escherichia coli]
MDGANVEMLDHVGADNIFILGNTAKKWKNCVVRATNRVNTTRR